MADPLFEEIISLLKDGYNTNIRRDETTGALVITISKYGYKFDYPIMNFVFSSMNLQEFESFIVDILKTQEEKAEKYLKEVKSNES